MSNHNCGTVVLLEVRLIEVLRYPTGTKLAGVVFVQRPTVDSTYPGYWLSRNIEALKELCGDTTLKNVIIMVYDWREVRPTNEKLLNSDFYPGGRLHSAIEQGAQVYHCTNASNPDLGALRMILRGRPVIPRVQKQPVNEGSGPERIAPATELSKEIPTLAESHDSDVKKLEESMQEVMDKKVRELRRELEEQKRRAQQEADAFEKRIAEMQSKEESTRRVFFQEREERERRAREEVDGLRKRIAELMRSELEGDRHGSGKDSATYNSPHVPAHPIREYFSYDRPLTWPYSVSTP